MAGGLLRVLVFLFAAAAVAQAGTWYYHGKPGGFGTRIWTALAPFTQFHGTKWFGVGKNGKLYERYKAGGSWHWIEHHEPQYGYYDKEPCVLEGAPKAFVMATGGHLFERFHNGNSWHTAYHGRPFYSSLVHGQACTSVHRHNLKARTFVRGSNGHLYERFWEWGVGWIWRLHGMAFGNIPLLHDIPMSSHLGDLSNSSWTNIFISHVYMVGQNNQVYERETHQDYTWNTWKSYGKPPGQNVMRVRVSLTGGVWVVTNFGNVCRLSTGWTCYPLLFQHFHDCSDPFTYGGNTISIFCITYRTLWQFRYFPPLNWGYWIYRGRPYLFHRFVDRPNVAFDASGNAKTVFVPSTRGVVEYHL